MFSLLTLRVLKNETEVNLFQCCSELFRVVQNKLSQILPVGKLSLTGFEIGKLNRIGLRKFSNQAPG